MPTLETPPRPVETPTPSPESAKLAAGRYGALDHSEIVHLLSTLDDEVARSRFRESVYISLIICLALAWFAFYGPRVLFHQGRIVNVSENSHKNELSYLETPKDLSKILPKPTKTISEHTAAAQTAHPEPKPPAPRPGAPGARTPPPAPRPQAQQTQQPQQPRPQQPQPQQPVPPTPQPQRPQQATNSIPDAPRPTQAPSKPSFATQNDPGQALRDAARNAAQQHGQEGEDGPRAPHGHQGAKTGVEILSDTLGTDFGPYIKRLLRSTRAAWVPLIPEECSPPLNKTGTTLIRFVIQPNGVVSAMHLDDSTRDQAIDRAAWGSITSQGQLPPLPTTFKGPNLELRIQFVIYNDGSATQ